MGGVLYTTYFECKRYSLDRPVGVEIVRELYAVMDLEWVDKGVIVTTSHFTRGAAAEVNVFYNIEQNIDEQNISTLSLLHSWNIEKHITE